MNKTQKKNKHDLQLNTTTTYLQVSDLGHAHTVIRVTLQI